MVLQLLFEIGTFQWVLFIYVSRSLFKKSNTDSMAMTSDRLRRLFPTVRKDTDVLAPFCLVLCDGTTQSLG